MSDPVQPAHPDSWWGSVARHFAHRKWAYIFAAFVWALVWYAAMNVLTIALERIPGLGEAAPFPVDIMPLIAGVPIIIVGWRAVALGNRLEKAIDNFDDGAAFVFPAGQAGAKKKFLNDLKKTISWYSKLVSAAIFLISLAGVILLTSINGADSVDFFITFLLIVGVPAIALPIGTLLGRLLGYGQFVRIMDRNGIELAGLSTPQAREALRELESLHVFAIIALTVLCFWFAGWWITWGLGYGLEYKSMWRTQFLVLWFVSIGLFTAAGIWPAWSFRRRVAKLAGGPEGRHAREEQIRQARADLEHWQGATPQKSRQQRERIAELTRFIGNLEDQRIERWLLDPRLLVFLLAINLAALVLPLLIPETHPLAAAF
ncbi:MAG: hypothetical protein E5X67_23430 [Mesorhizobium sp.]|uniref:hypothetical protein n=1 Tax=Mesorhizobium sp. TaxID=1871066 RepID=UPI00121909FE|nr:hypothetical protein [Mesorhizobium sp.]TIP25748.1 MAG: hypothetical protein E5X67_23430 [Mesorhizobium sp.]